MNRINFNYALPRVRPRTISLIFVLASCPAVRAQTSDFEVAGIDSMRPAQAKESQPAQTYREIPHDSWKPRPARFRSNESRQVVAVQRGPFRSRQVNVNSFGLNIFGDAANEPSIAVDPTNPNRIVIGWRQFDSVDSDFRQGGWAYSHDGGLTWTFPGVLEPVMFRSDPVLDADAEGNFYFYSGYSAELFSSNDAGLTWNNRFFSFGGDKPWMTIDRTGGIGNGNLYFVWTDNFQFTRSTDGGTTFLDPLPTPANDTFWGTLAVDSSGFLYLVDRTFRVVRSTNARFPNAIPTFKVLGDNLLGGGLLSYFGPNPCGLLGQAWIATDRSFASTSGNIYVLGSVGQQGSHFSQVMFARSEDGGATWSDPIRINDDSPNLAAWHWFGTLSVAPNGRIDVIWNDTRNTGQTNLSELFYSFSTDGGISWSKNIPVSPVFDSSVGRPSRQGKIGDYYDMVSDFGGVNIAYAATFNGEQDVYFLRIEVEDCNENGVLDADDIFSGSSNDCDANGVPDECQNDCNHTGVADRCDVINGTSFDCNGNFVPDECDPDFDHDGTTDTCDSDIDDDGILNELDTCLFAPLDGPRTDDGRPFSDTNFNCSVDLTDYVRFRNCLGAGGPDVNAPQATCLSVFDYNDDGHVDLRDAAGFGNAFTGLP